MGNKNIIVSFIVFFILGWAPIDVVRAFATLTRLQITQSKANTQLIFTLKGKPPIEAFSLSNPARFVVDFKQTRTKINLPKGSFAQEGYVSKVRTGYPDKTTLRLVFDLHRQVSFQKKWHGSIFMITLNAEEKTFVPLPPLGGQKQVPQKITQTKKNFTHASFREPTPKLSLGGALKTKKVFSHPVLAWQKLTIVIDPGHGGKDPGAIGFLGTKEKHVVLAIAQKLARLINANPTMHAVLTRVDDRYIPLRTRLRLARQHKADLFIAIHADSYFNAHARGASVYALSARGATTMAARWLAEKENHSELGKVDLSNLEDQSYLLRSVLIDLAQTQTTRISQEWGFSLLQSLDSVTRLHYTKVEQAPFLVLKSPDIPSVLVEVGFLSNAHEELRLQERSYQDRLASALYQGIRSYKVIR